MSKKKQYACTGKVDDIHARESLSSGSREALLWPKMFLERKACKLIAKTFLSGAVAACCVLTHALVAKPDRFKSDGYGSEM